MKIKKRKVSINSAFKSKKKRKNDNLSDEELNDVNSFNKELAEIAKRDPELYEFLKKEEADIFDKEKEDYDDVEEVEHEDVEEEDDFEDDDLDDEEGEDMDSEAGESLDSKEDATLDSEENESTDSEEDMDDEEDDKHVEDPLDAQTSDNEASVVDDQSIVPVKRDHETVPTVMYLRRRGCMYNYSGRLVVSSELLDFLEAVLHDPSSVDKATFQQAVETTVKAFISCVARVGDVYSKLTDGQSDFVIYDEQIFDRVLCLCFKSMGKSLYKLLNPAKGNIKSRQKYKKYNHFKNWRRYRPIAKCYLEAIHIFLLELNSNKVIVEAIRALADLVDIFIHFPKLSKNIIKCLVKIWSQQQIEEARCISFAVLCKISRMEKSFFPKIYKNCYVAYISNCKLINEETLPFINLMKASFIEFTLMYPKLSYQYAFVYIRQFAIHLRNAMIAKRRDLIQRVYNWQFLKGLKLWASLISEGTHRSALSDGKEQAISSEKNDRNSWFKELIYPIVEIVLIMGRIFPSSKYLPLRIHCLRILLNLQEYCNIYVPTLAFAFELLDDLAQIDVKKPKSGKGTTKGVSLEQILRLSNDQLEDAGVRQHLAQQLFLSSEQALKLLKLRERCPETLLIPLQGKLKRFLKKCSNREHVHLFIKLKEQMAEN